MNARERRAAGLFVVALLAGGLVTGVSGTLTVDDPASAADDARQGRFLYGLYCSNCHGEFGRGDGPAAKSLDPSPVDLTRISIANDGVFPEDRVRRSIDGRTPTPGHDRQQMPIWGLTFQDSGSDANQEREVRTRVRHLVRYLESIQSDGD